MYHLPTTPQINNRGLITCCQHPYEIAAGYLYPVAFKSPLAGQEKINQLLALGIKINNDYEKVYKTMTTTGLCTYCINRITFQDDSLGRHIHPIGQRVHTSTPILLGTIMQPYFKIANRTVPLAFDSGHFHREVILLSFASTEIILGCQACWLNSAKAIPLRLREIK